MWRPKILEYVGPSPLESVSEIILLLVEGPNAEDEYETALVALKRSWAWKPSIINVYRDNIVEFS